MNILLFMVSNTRVDTPEAPTATSFGLSPWADIQALDVGCRFCMEVGWDPCDKVVGIYIKNITEQFEDLASRECERQYFWTKTL